METSLILWASAPMKLLGGGGTQIPEPSNLALFGLGIAGLVIGRRIARLKKSDPQD